MLRKKTETYEGRRTELLTVRGITEDGAVTFVKSWSFHPGKEKSDLLREGEEYYVEMRSAQIVGMGVDDASGGVNWLWRKSDQDLEREHEEFRTRVEAEREETWQKNRDDWWRRELALESGALRARLARFREAGGEHFEREGWGYELVVSELCELYVVSGGDESSEIEAYAVLEGTSGNQHQYARAMARTLAKGDETMVAEESVSALTPLTGDPDWSGQKDKGKK